MTKLEEGKNLPSSRRGKSNVSFYVDRDEHKKLKLLAVEENTSIQALGEEALELLFKRYEKKSQGA